MRSISATPIVGTQEYNVFQQALDIEPDLAAWWNPLGRIAAPSFFSQLMEGDKYMLDLELTQKIIQVKELAVKNGQWPEKMDYLESEICPGFTWVYQVEKNGTMSLSLNPEPEWQADRLENNRGLPLIYRDRTITGNTSQ